jgi:hypothetical protein
MAIFRRITVLLDHSTPYRGAFAQALQWARRLRLPVHGVSLCEQEKPAEFELVCDRFALRWDLSQLSDGAAFGLNQEFEPADLVVFGHSLPTPKQKDVFRTAARHATLVCPENYEPLSRMAIVDEGGGGSSRFLSQAAELAHCCRVAPTVLTVGRSEQMVRHQQESAREILAAFGLDADFDSIVGSETRGIAANVARWRRAQLIVMQGRCTAAWWRWLRGDAPERRLALFSAFSVLTLPEAGEPVFSTKNHARPKLASRFYGG